MILCQHPGLSLGEATFACLMAKIAPPRTTLKQICCSYVRSRYNGGLFCDAEHLLPASMLGPITRRVAKVAGREATLPATERARRRETLVIH